MADSAFTLTAAPILGGVDQTIGRNRILERADLAIVSIAIPHGGQAILQVALQHGWDLAEPEPGGSSVSGDTRAVWTAPDQILLLIPHATPDANAVVQQRLNGAGYTTDQTDVWVILEISGPQTLSALERLCPLHVANFPEGGAARTVMHHMGAMIVRLESERFLLLSASSSARSFLHEVETSYHNVMPSGTTNSSIGVLPSANRRKAASWPDGRPVFTLPMVLGLLIFYAWCLQCAATIAVIRRETNGWRWPIFAWTYMTVLGYSGAFLVYQLGSLVG